MVLGLATGGGAVLATGQFPLPFQGEIEAEVEQGPTPALPDELKPATRPLFRN